MNRLRRYWVQLVVVIGIIIYLAWSFSNKKEPDHWSDSWEGRYKVFLEQAPKQEHFETKLKGRMDVPGPALFYSAFVADEQRPGLDFSFQGRDYLFIEKKGFHRGKDEGGELFLFGIAELTDINGDMIKLIVRKANSKLIQYWVTYEK